MNQNYNGFFKRVRNGDWRLAHEWLTNVKRRDPDVIFAAEVRGCPLSEKSTKMAASTLKAMLFAQGYQHVAWNWCVDKPEIHGTAVFSKVPWDKIHFGTQDGTTDPEGRTITAYFGGIAAVCTYTPCSSMDDLTPIKDESRRKYNTDYLAHFLKVQDEVGEGAAFGCGDFNVAPTERHVNRGTAKGRVLPSTKAYERRAYEFLLRQAKLMNAAKGTAFEFKPTWRTLGPLALAMTIDHVLAPIDDRRIHIYDYEVLSDSFGSDHYAVLYTVAPRDAVVATMSPTYAELPARSKRCLVHRCAKHAAVVVLTSSHQCCLSGCSSTEATCTDPVCFEMAHCAYTRATHGTKPGPVGELAKCLGPKEPDPRKDQPYVMPKRWPKHGSLATLLQQRILDLKGAMRMDDAKRHKTCMYHSCIHGRWALAALGKTCGCQGTTPPEIGNVCDDPDCCTMAKQLHKLMGKGQIPIDIMLSEMSSCEQVCFRPVDTSDVGVDEVAGCEPLPTTAQPPVRRLVPNTRRKGILLPPLPGTDPQAEKRLFGGLAKDIAEARTASAAQDAPQQRLNGARSDANATVATPCIKPDAPKSGKPPKSWKELMRSRGWVKVHVRGSGTCWIFAPLAAFGLCDHAFTSQDKAEGNEKSLDAPSTNDQARQGVLRTMVGDMHTWQGATPEAVANARLCCKYYGAQATSEHDRGGYGSEAELRVLCEILKTSIIVIDADAIEEEDGRGALSLIYSPTTGTVSNEVWSPEEVDRHDNIAGSAQCVYLAYSAKAQHYDLFKPVENLTLSVRLRRLLLAPKAKVPVQQEVYTPESWKELIQVSDLTLRHVRASSDWLHASLVPFGVCDHAFSTADAAAGNAKSTGSPSTDDQGREAHLRGVVGDAFAEQDKSAAEVEAARRCTIYRGLDVTDGCTPGGDGGVDELRVLSRVLKASIYIVDADAVAEVHVAAGQDALTHCLVYSYANDVVTDTYWSPREAYVHAQQPGARVVYLAHSAKRRRFDVFAPPAALSLPHALKRPLHAPIPEEHIDGGHRDALLNSVGGCCGGETDPHGRRWPPARMPKYEVKDEKGRLPHYFKDRCPTSNLWMGDSETTTKVLWDTGAYYNIMAVATAKALRAEIHNDRNFPTLCMADKSKNYIVGRVHVPVEVSPFVWVEMEFFILPEASATIIGAHFMTEYDTTIGLSTTKGTSITLVVEGRTCPVAIVGAAPPALRHATAINAYAARPTTVSPYSFANVEVAFEESAHFSAAAVKEGMWGILQDAENYPVIVATGVTCIVEPGVTAHYMCRVFNGTAHQITVGAPLKDGTANMTPIAHFAELAEEYDMVDADKWAGPTADSALCVPLTGKEYVALDEQWARHKHLHAIDISSAEKRLKPDEFTRLKLLLIKHQELWDHRPKPAPAGVETCSFKVKPGARFRANLRPMGNPAREELSQQTKAQEKAGIIENSTSEFSSAIVLIPKKGGGVRFAIDYRALNKNIVADEYTLPNVQEGLAALGGDAKTPPLFFSALDIKEAFWSVPLDVECRKYTAFQTPDGLKQYRRMPMGLKTASAVFCRYIDRILGNMKWTKVLAYIDDLLVFGRGTAADHITDLDELFTKLRESNLTLGANKCTLFAEQVKYLGHIVSSQGVAPDPDKVKAIEAIADKPATAKLLNSAMGLISYYRKFIQGFAAIARPLHDKIKRSADWITDVTYSEEEATNFVKLRDALKGEPILAHPDWTRPFELHTDACKLGLGAQIVQKVDKVERPISFASRSLTAAECNYSQWELECLAIVWAMRLFRMYLALATFLVVTDATAAKRIMEGTKNDAGRVVRWALAVQEFDYTIEQRSACQLAGPDGLSRYSHPSTAPYNEGVTEIEPSTWLTPLRPDGTHEAFFGPEDLQAETIAEWKALQDVDPWCMKKALKAGNCAADTTPGHLYRGTTGLLYRKSVSGSAADQVLVPVSLRAFILNRYHGLPVTGHMGRRRTHAQVKEFYWWQGLYSDVTKWVGACLACRKRKASRNMHAGVPAAVSNASRPWETVAIDTVSAKSSKEGYTKILTILDTFSRYVITVPLKSTTAEEVSKALMANLFCVFGRPDKIITDDGSEFLNSALRAINKRWGIHHHSTGGYQPHGNPVERYHRFLNSAMTTLALSFGDDWPSYLPASTFAYNASTNDATGYSPYELIMARGSPVLLQHIDLQPTPSAGPGIGASLVDFYVQAGDRIMASYAHVRDQQQRIVKQRNEAIMAKRGPQQRKLVTFEIGDNVLFWEPRQSITAMEAADAEASWTEAPPAKWTYNWSGPHQIIAKVPDATGFRYTFYHEKRRTTIETHVNKLIVFEPWSEGIMSTSLGIDARRNYRAGEWAACGEMVVVPMTAPEPFGVGKIIEHTAGGDLVLQWFSNATNSPFVSYLPGWIDSAGAPYYAHRPISPTHAPYTSVTEGMDIHQCDVVLHSFSLTANDRLATRILTSLAENPLVWWTKSPAEIAATTMAWDAAAQALTETAASGIRDKGDAVHARVDMEVDEDDAEHDGSDLGTVDGSMGIRDKGEDEQDALRYDSEGIRDKGEIDPSPMDVSLAESTDIIPVRRPKGKRDAECTVAASNKRSKTDEGDIARVGATTRARRKIVRPPALSNTAIILQGSTPMSRWQM